MGPGPMDQENRKVAKSGDRYVLGLQWGLALWTRRTAESGGSLSAECQLQWGLALWTRRTTCRR